MIVAGPGEAAGKDRRMPQTSCAPPPAPPLQIIKALFDHTPDPAEAGPNELAFRRGDFFYVTAREYDTEWYEVCNPAVGASANGLVPVSFFEVVQSRADVEASAAAAAAAAAASSASPAPSPAQSLQLPADDEGSAEPSLNAASGYSTALVTDTATATATATDATDADADTAAAAPVLSARVSVRSTAVSATESAASVAGSGSVSASEPRLSFVASNRSNSKAPSAAVYDSDACSTTNSSSSSGRASQQGIAVPAEPPANAIAAAVTNAATAGTTAASHRPSVDLRASEFSIPEHAQAQVSYPTAPQSHLGGASNRPGAGLALVTSFEDARGATRSPTRAPIAGASSVAPTTTLESPTIIVSPTLAAEPPTPFTPTTSISTSSRSNLRSPRSSAAGVSSPVSTDPSAMSSKPSPAAFAAASKGAMVYAVVLYDFKAERPDELDAKEGDAIIVIARSTPDWVVAKPIGRLGGPGLVPVSFLEIRDLVTGQPVPDAGEAIVRANVPRVEEWKKMTAEYKNSSISLGKLDASAAASGSASQQQQLPRDDGASSGRRTRADGSYSHGSVQSVRSAHSAHSAHSARTHASTRSGRSMGSSGHQSHLADQMARMDIGSGVQHDHHMSSAQHHQQHHSHQQQPPPQDYAVGLAPVLASIPRYTFDQDTYWYTIECKMEDGSCWELQRYYEDFYQLQINLLNAFDAEAGRVEGHPRTLPFMPGPVKVVTDAISNGRRQNLDEYIKKLLQMPPHISGSAYVRHLFVPREGDFEIDPVLYNDELACVDSTLDSFETTLTPQEPGETTVGPGGSGSGGSGKLVHGAHDRAHSPSHSHSHSRSLSHRRSSNQQRDSSASSGGRSGTGSGSGSGSGHSRQESMNSSKYAAAPGRLDQQQHGHAGHSHGHSHGYHEPSHPALPQPSSAAPQDHSPLGLPYPPSIGGTQAADPRYSNRTSTGSGGTMATSRTTTTSMASSNGGGAMAAGSGSVSSFSNSIGGHPSQHDSMSSASSSSSRAMAMPPPHLAGGMNPRAQQQQQQQPPHMSPQHHSRSVSQSQPQPQQYPAHPHSHGHGHGHGYTHSQSQSQSQSQSRSRSRPPSVTSPTSLVPPTKNPSVIVASIPPTTAATAVKIKISYRNEWLAIRVGEQTGLAELQAKLRQRLKVQPGQDVHVQVQRRRERPDGSAAAAGGGAGGDGESGSTIYLADLDSQETWEECLRSGNGKVTLYVEDI
ncbi:bud emergence protein 1 [Ascosphaera acerosa]|nr:bud emergence protein 1 [Ascosphaera acerosa]